MPTTRERLTITKVPHVERILEIGRVEYPGFRDKEVLLALAAERAAELLPTVPRGQRSGLTLLPQRTDGMLTETEIEALLNGL